MIGQIKTINGAKQIVPLAGGSGNPLGTILPLYSSVIPSGYLLCDGSQFSSSTYPALYALLGDDHTPDLRECVLVGAGTNSTDTIADHDVYTVGEFKDDQVQTHSHRQAGYSIISGSTYIPINAGNGYTVGSRDYTENNTGRSGNTTRTKQKGVNYIIKATTGLEEAQQDYILSQFYDQMKGIVAASSNFADFQTRMAAL